METPTIGGLASGGRVDTKPGMVDGAGRRPTSSRAGPEPRRAFHFVGRSALLMNFATTPRFGFGAREARFGSTQYICSVRRSPRQGLKP